MAFSADDVRKMLGENEAQMRRCAAQSAAIRRSAREELDRVTARLAEMKPGQVARDPVMAHAYQRLGAERGRLALLAGA